MNSFSQVIHSFLLLSARNLFRKNRLFTFINITGLAIGLASLILIALFIHDEYSFDKFHKKSDRIYRIVLDFTSEGNTISWARTSAPIGQYLPGVYPEIEEVARIRKNPGTDLLARNELKFYEERLFFADSSIFKVFDFPLILGNPWLALKEKNSIVVTEKLAKKYFGESNPVGETLRLHNQIDLKITGVMHEVPGNSHFVADAFVTFSTLEDILGKERLTHWGWNDHHTYVLLANGSAPAEVEKKFPPFLKRSAPEWVADNEKLFLQPLTSIHLHSDLKDEITPNSNEGYSYILGTIALFILLMACANFVNLSTATMISRFKEISIQKVLGAGRFHLAIYFLIESVIICLLAAVLSYLLVFVSLPYFNLATGKQILIQENLWAVAPIFLLAILIGFFSSMTPNVQAMRLNVLRVKHPAYMMHKSYTRTALITFQFCVSILLITATWIVSSQSSFLNSSRVGFNSDKVVVIPVKDRSMNDRHSVFASEIDRLPGVAGVSYSSSMPACNNAYTYAFTFAGTQVVDQPMATFFADENFYDLYEIKLKEGRLPVVNAGDTLPEIILNEAAVRQLELSQPIGQEEIMWVKGKVVGIVENFNYQSLHSPIQPMAMYSYTPNFRFVSVKLEDGYDQNTIKSLEGIWENLYPGYPMEYFFLDDKIQQLYSDEIQLSLAYTSFSVIAIIIASIGLIGLTTYLLTKKLKEISIRKVFGSSTFQLVRWIYSGYFKIIIIAAILAGGLSYYWMSHWLEGFAFRTELKVGHFVYPSITMIFILLLTTIIQTVKASHTNPVNNLREE